MIYWIIYIIACYLVVGWTIRKFCDCDESEIQLTLGLVFLFSPFTIIFVLAFLAGKALTWKR